MGCCPKVTVTVRWGGVHISLPSKGRCTRADALTWGEQDHRELIEGAPVERSMIAAHKDLGCSVLKSQSHCGRDTVIRLRDGDPSCLQLPPGQPSQGEIEGDVELRLVRQERSTI